MGVIKGFAISVASAFVWFFLVGFQGISLAEVTSLNRARNLAKGGTELIGPHPGADLLSAAAIRLFPVSNVEASWLGGVLLVSIAVGFIFVAGRRLGGAGAGIAAAIFAAGSIDAFWAATGTLPASIGFVFGAAAILATTLERPGQRHLCLAVGGGLAILTILPMVLPFAALWIMELFRDRRERDHFEGTTSTLGLPLTFLVVPLVVLAVPFLSHPGLWSNSLNTMGHWLESAFSSSPGVFYWYGEAYIDARPPLYAGIWAILSESNTVLVLLSLIGLTTSALDRIQRICVLTALGLLVLTPWFIRGMMWGDMPWNATWAPFVAVLSAVGLVTLARKAFEREATPKPLVALVIALLLLGPVVESLAYRPAPGAFRNAFVGQKRALEMNEPLRRDARLPIAALQDLDSVAEGSFRPIFEEYRRAEIALPSAGPEAIVIVRSRYESREHIAPGSVRRHWSIDGIPYLWVVEP